MAIYYQFMETNKRSFFSLFLFLLISYSSFSQKLGASQIKLDGTTIAADVNNALHVISGSMVYPGTGIALSTGSAWGTSITDNSLNWNTAYTNRITSLTTTGSSGASTLASNTLNIPTYTLAGLGGISLSSLSATSPIFYNSGTGVISSQAATSLVNGYLTSTDWSTFNGKFNTPAGTTAQYLRGDGSLASFPSIPSVGTWGALNYPSWSSGTPFVKMTAAGTFALDASTYLTSIGTGTTNELTYWSGTNTIGSLATATYPSLTELSYVKGVTSDIQTQLGNKASASAESSQSRVLSAAVSLTTSTPANVTATALSLAAGTWDISAMGGFLVGTSTSVLTSIVAISITSGTLPSNDAYAVPNTNGEVIAKTNQTATGIVQTTGSAYTISIPQYRFTFAAPVTLYLVANSVFVTSTLKAYGSIRAIPVK